MLKFFLLFICILNVHIIDEHRRRSLSTVAGDIGGAYQGLGHRGRGKFLTVFCVLTVITLISPELKIRLFV